MGSLSITALRRIQREFEFRLGDLVDWESFSIDQVRTSVAARVGGEIILVPFHWEQRGYFGLTLGCTTPQGRKWLVLFEQDAGAEHCLVIVLHELMHILFGHCSAEQPPEELRRELSRLGLVPGPSDEIVYARVCMPDEHRHADPGDQEGVAELASTWIVTKARRAGTLPPAGQTIGTQQIAISSFLGWEVEDH